MGTILVPLDVNAQQSGAFAGGNHIENEKRLSLARSFVSRLKAGLGRASEGDDSSSLLNEGNILDDGEILLLQPILKKNFHIDGMILGLVHNKLILLSLRDITDVLQMAISLDIEKKTANGWYVREDKKFDLNINNKTMRSDMGEFKLSDNVIVKDNDIWIPADELGLWMGFKFNPVIDSQELKITSSEMLPIQERYNRRNFEFVKRKTRLPSLPRGGEGYKAIGIPSIDVATSSSYRKNNGDLKGVAKHSADIKTSGDFAYGTLTTRSRVNNDDQLSSVRVTYKQESSEGDLLGALKARKFEVGDIITSRVPMGGQVKQEMGVRITNTDNMRAFKTPTTGISGTAFPGWDVELYRDNQVVGFREVGEDGFYNFEDIDLYLVDNNFKLIFYGPQGEVREENVFVPVNQSLARGRGAYDVSISLDKKNAYNANPSPIENPDEGSINISAYYEKPIMDGTTISAGLWSSENDEKRNSAVNVGFSTIVAQTLVNGGFAVDDDGDLSGELSLRRDLGEHELRNSLKWLGDNFDTQSGGEQQTSGSLQNNFNVSGPLPFGNINQNTYSAGVAYSLDSDGEYDVTTNAGMSSSIKNILFNERLYYKTGSNMEEDTLHSFTNVTGAYGRNRFRLSADYAFLPDSELVNVLATYRRDITNDVNIELGVSKRPQQSLMEYSAKMDWQAGFMRISPSIRYNSEQAFFAGLNTRFGLLRDPSHGRINMYDRTITSAGAVSAFVFLDKNGDGIFNGDDEPLKGIVVKAPQNGGREITDENGIALFNKMSNLRLTDIFLDKETLQDPTWVSSFEGVSILPREGYVAEVTFPVHISGEIDGSVYARSAPSDEGGGAFPLRNVAIKIYNDKGEVEQTAKTDSSGFYYFPQIPPGRYFLIIDSKSAANGSFIRPEPQKIEIGYDGTVIYNNNLYVDRGEGDIPSAFLSDLEDYKSRHPHIDFSDKNNDLVLNLGEFNSRLLMSVVWYKLRSRYHEILKDGELFVPPAQSYANINTGKHTLRFGLKGGKLDDAYARCRALIARGRYCKVEIYPSYMKQANAAN